MKFNCLISNRIEKGFLFVLFLLVLPFTTVIAESNQQKQEFDEISTSDDALFNDDALFGGGELAGSDDALFGGDELAGSDDALFGGGELAGSDDSLFGGDDDMFSDSDMIQDIVPADSTKSESVSASALGIIFEAGSVRFGGSLSGSVSASSIWYDPYDGENQTSKFWGDGFKNAMLSPDIGADLFFDARPKENLRLYGKINIGYPFKDNLGIPSFSVFELFTDFSWNDKIFFRFGKHTVNWGVGYFFSPADIINLATVDPQNPSKQREGPISLRSQIIFPGTQNCLWLYALPDDSLLSGTGYARYTAFAGKYEFLIGNYELGVGGWYKYERSPRLCMTLTGSINKLSIFGEGVVAYGTEKQWQTVASGQGSSIPYSQMWPICQATIGGSYSWKTPKISMSFQYFYNGFGSFNPIDLTQAEFNELQSWYGYSGQHYVALSLSKSELFTRRLSASAFSLMSVYGFSGMASGTLSFSFFDNCSVSFGPTFTFGEKGGEFTRISGLAGKENISAKLAFSFGGGKF